MQEIKFSVDSNKLTSLLSDLVTIVQGDNNAWNIILSLDPVWKGNNNWISIKYYSAEKDGYIRTDQKMNENSFLLHNGYTQGDYIEIAFAMYGMPDEPPKSAYTRFIQIPITRNTPPTGGAAPEEIQDLMSQISNVIDLVENLDTSKLPAYDPSSESLSGDSATQSEINSELVYTVNSQQNKLSNHEGRIKSLEEFESTPPESSGIAITDPVSESPSGLAETQADVNAEVTTQITSLWQLENTLENKLNTLPEIIQSVITLDNENIALIKNKSIYTHSPTGNTTYTFDVSGLGDLTDKCITFELHIEMPDPVVVITFPSNIDWVINPVIDTGGVTYCLVFRSMDGGVSWVGNLAYTYGGAS